MKKKITVYPEDPSITRGGGVHMGSFSIERGGCTLVIYKRTGGGEFFLHFKAQGDEGLGS